ncbi:MAG: carbohydrate-binding family 9-like protein [Acidobacteria bacterium]|nr:carbohydrate-binding family 9-like protein [Acidobacteriota bacterium]
MPMLVVFLASLLMVAASTPQDAGGGDDDGGYGVRRSSAATEALLGAGRDAWERALEVSWGPEIYATSFRALWGEEGLFVRFDAVDPSPWHTLRERDDHLWNEEVVEIFIDPDGDGRNYAEVEINPHNVVCDLLIFEGSPNLRSDIDWDHDGLQSSVQPLHGADGETVGWTAVALLPWSGFATLPDIGGVPLPPRAGDVWGFNIFRIKRPSGPAEPELDAVYAAWSPTSGPSFHEPAVFRALEFIE